MNVEDERDYFTKTKLRYTIGIDSIKSEMLISHTR